MGWGDEIMVTAVAREMQRTDRRKVAVLNRHGAPRWHDAWIGNPRIAHPDEVRGGLEVQAVQNCGGRRPYVDTTDRRHWRYTDWRVPGPGELYLTERERSHAPLQARKGRYIVLEPHIKPGASVNKQWPWSRWEALAERLARQHCKGYDIVQLGPTGTRTLKRAGKVATPSFRAACAVLEHAAAAVLPDGGLHHAAAALGVPAVVIFGGFTSPRNLGYDMHTNIADNGPRSPCGRREACKHCEAAMNAIDVGSVAEALVALLERRQ